MKITSKQYAKSLIGAIAENPGKEKFYLDNFLKIISANNDEKKLPQIIEEFKKAEARESGVKEAIAISAIAISGETRNLIVKKLESCFKSKIKLAEKIDPQILGGLILEAGDEVMDASVAAAIGKLKHSLNS